MSSTGRLGRESDDMDVLKESLEKLGLGTGPEYNVTLHAGLHVLGVA